MSRPPLIISLPLREITVTFMLDKVEIKLIDFDDDSKNGGLELKKGALRVKRWDGKLMGMGE
jgi:hypothetical protein